MQHSQGNQLGKQVKRRFNDDEGKRPYTKKSFEYQQSTEWAQKQNLNYQVAKLCSKVATNDTLTIKRHGDPLIYLQIVSIHFSNSANSEIRLEALSSAITQMFLIVDLLEISGIAIKVKVKLQ